jgi:hypothetical protein
MRMRRTTLTISCLIALAASACGDQANTISDLIADAPAACADWCEDRTACGWDASDWVPDELAEQYGQDQLDAVIDRCVADCLYYLDEGALVYETVIAQCDGYNNEGECIDATYEHRAHDPIPGGRLRKYLSCIREFYACEGAEPDPEDQSWTSIAAEDQASCEEKARCYDALGLEGYVKLEWTQAGDVGVCNYFAPEREYHFLGPAWL